MKNKFNKKSGLLLSLVFIISLFSFVYINYPAKASVAEKSAMIDQEELYQEKMSPEVTAVKFMLGIASFFITSER